MQALAHEIVLFFTTQILLKGFFSLRLALSFSLGGGQSAKSSTDVTVQFISVRFFFLSSARQNTNKTRKLSVLGS